MLSPRKLSEIIPDDIFVGTSLILPQGDRFLYGIRPVRQVESQHILELTGIGGGLEDMELPHLIWLKLEHILETAREDVPLRKLLNTGAELIVGDLEAPSEGYLVRLTDSQEALVQH